MKSVLLLAFGGPRTLEEVKPFLARLMKREPSPAQLKRVEDRYRLIGGGSPLPGITRMQAEHLEKTLNGMGYGVRTYVGMRYGHPLIEETLTQIHVDGIEDIVAVPLAPFRSVLSTGVYREEVNRSLQRMGNPFRVSWVEGWHTHPLFLRAIQERIEEALSRFPIQERERIQLVFTAHSLPVSVVKVDPYLNDMEESVRGVLNLIGPFPYHLALQSKGSGAEEWAGPDVESTLTKIAREKASQVLIVPIGFVSDHVEILYDIDILYKDTAQSLGLRLERTESLNASERFIEALAEVTKTHLC